MSLTQKGYFLIEAERRWAVVFGFNISLLRPASTKTHSLKPCDCTILTLTLQMFYIKQKKRKVLESTGYITIWHILLNNSNLSQNICNFDVQN